MLCLLSAASSITHAFTISETRYSFGVNAEAQIKDTDGSVLDHDSKAASVTGFFPGAIIDYPPYITDLHTAVSVMNGGATPASMISGYRSKSGMPVAIQHGRDLGVRACHGHRHRSHARRTLSIQ